MNNTLVIGNGGREHAIVHSLLSSPQVDKIFILNGNGGTQSHPRTKNVPGILPSEHDKILHFINKENIELCIIGPEAPLSEGIVDFLEKAGKKVFGPSLAASRIESSKIFMKDVLVKAGVPTAKYKAFNESQKEEALSFLKEFGSSNIVIKADGLAAGKGVVIAKTLKEAEKTLIEFFDGKFGKASKSLVIEEFLDGFEVSLFGISDGENVICFKSACDHKRIFENDLGENTGGMGTFSPSFLSAEREEELVETLIRPVVLELKSRGIIYKGVLFAGLMILEDEVKVLEFNARLGDPEAQSILTRFTGDFYELCKRAATGNLKNYKPSFSSKSAVTVVLASKGYPQSSSKNDEISLPSKLEEGNFIFHAGTKMEEGKLLTNGGRVLGVTALGETKLEARKSTYKVVSNINFDGMQFRRDIGEDLVLLEINFAEEGWKRLGIGFYSFFTRLLKITLKKHFSMKKEYFSDPNKRYEFSILLTNDEEITKLNTDFRGKKKPTNTLSFPIGDEYENGKILMGDIVLSLNTLQKEAQEQEKSFEEHMAHLFVHSALHLIGYDHEKENEMEEMESLEDNILNEAEI